MVEDVLDSSNPQNSDSLSTNRSCHGLVKTTEIDIQEHTLKHSSEKNYNQIRD